ncbi:hypothetical protein [uncultured Variovorax sp.]|uniref:hypothetical protein n=1 Tax=uncultured Variovorax sp. TaxID=114708 RepID=UPI0025D5DEFD|nr:hypothetical protein [uncultured Variovorax sp.]
MTPSPQPESPEPLKVALQPMTPGIYAGELTMFPSYFGKYCRLSDAIAAIQAARNEAEAMRADARGALVLALSCIRWQSFGECRTPGHGGAPPAPDAAAKAIEAAIATLGGRGQ